MILDLPLDAAMTYGGAIALRATAVLVGALALAFTLRRSSASARHALWSVIVVALLILPVAQWALPPISIPVFWSSGGDGAVPPAEPTHSAAIDDAPLVDKATDVLESRSPSPLAAVQSASLDHSGSSLLDVPMARDLGTASADAVVSSTPTRRPVDVPLELFLVLWFIGASAVAVPLFVGVRRARTLRDEASLVEDVAWCQSVDHARASVGLRKPVSIHVSPAVRMAMTGGLLRPFVLLPESALTWSAERREIVLLHELVHARRGDALRQVFGRAVLAIYWFHPLAWRAVRAASLAREQACDEAVLGMGKLPSIYARHLLDLSEPGPLPLPALSLIDRPQLEQRIMNILRFKTSLGSRRAVVAASLVGAIWAVTAGAAVPNHRDTSSGIAQRSDAGAQSASHEERQVDVETDLNAGIALIPEVAVPLEVDFDLEYVALPGLRESPMGAGRSTALGCLPDATRRGFSSAWASADERTVVARRIDDIWLCISARGWDPSLGFPERLDLLPSGTQVVLATIGESGYKRLEVSVGSNGLGQTWFVDEVERPFDASAREWRDAVLTVGRGYWEVNHLRAEQGSFRAQIAKENSQVADFSRLLASLHAGTRQIRVRTEADRARADRYALQAELTRRQVQDGPAPDLVLSLGRMMDRSTRDAILRLTARLHQVRLGLDAAENTETRERLSLELETLRNSLQERLLDVTPEYQQQVAELVREFDQLQRESETQVAVLKEAIAALESAERENVTDSSEQTAYAIQVLEAQLADLNTSTNVARLSEQASAVGMEIQSLEERIEPATRRLLEIIRR